MNWMDNRLELNFDATFRCPLECPKCMRQTYAKRGSKVEGVDCSLENFEKLTDWFTDMRFCGQVSDPTAHPKFLELLEICARKKLKVKVHNAASHKSIDWYKKAFATYPKAVWEFGLDGLPKDSHKYRVNQDGEKLWSVMKWARGEGYPIDWQWIYFDYNWRDIPQGFQMAEKYGINFITVTSHRWSINDPLRPPDEVMRCEDVYQLMELIESGYDG